MKTAEEIVAEIRDRILKHSAQQKLAKENREINISLAKRVDELKDLLRWIDRVGRD